MTAPDPHLEEIEGRLSKATPGPWEFVGADLESCGVPWVSVIESTVDCMSYCYGGSVRQEVKPADAEFIAAAPADVAYLLAELRKAQAKLARVEAIAADLAERGGMLEERGNNGSIYSTRAEGRGIGYREAARALRAAVADATGGERG